MPMRVFYWLLLIQMGLAGAIVFGDVGFDKPGKYGLDSGDAIWMLAAYGAALLLGVGVAIRRKQGWGLAVQLMPVLVWLGYRQLLLRGVFDSKYDASEYQYLVGMSKEDLVRVIGAPRNRVSVITYEAGAEVEYLSLRGMRVVMSVEGVVLRVEPNNRQ